MATTLPWGFEFVRSAKWVNEFRPRGGTPDPDLRGALLPDHLRHPLLALLCEGHRAAPSGHPVRHRAARDFPDALLHRVYQDRAGGVRTGMGARYGAMAEHSVYRAGYLHDLPGVSGPEVSPGAESPGSDSKKRRNDEQLPDGR